MTPILTLDSFWKTFAQTTVATPAYEVMILLVLTSMCLLTKWTRLGLLLTFVYVYRWGWLYMHQEFSGQNQMLVGYYVAGVLVMVSSVIALMITRYRAD